MSDKSQPVETPKKHEYLEAEMYYEARRVKKSRMLKWCEHCGKELPIGSTQDVHTFYPEFNAYPTHPECSQPFIDSLN